MAKKSNSTPDSAPPRVTASSKAVKTPKAAAPKHRKTKATVSDAPNEEPAVPSFTITREDIATLAFSYWERRGCQGGSQQEDWDRAERELRSLIG